MILSTTTYQGEKHCDIVHAPSQTQIQTDAPKDNQGRGQSFSPTDLIGAALGSCILTTVAILCEKDGLNLVGARAEVTKEMVSDPRRIAKLGVKLFLPKGIALELRPKLQQVALGCPVTKSIHPDIQNPIEFIYPD